MAFPSVTYTFSNSTTADATQVNQDFSDIINGLSDGTKDQNINASTINGALTTKGNVTLGNSSSNSLTFNCSLASSIPVLVTNSYDIGSNAFGLRALYLGSGATANSTKIAGASVSAAWTFTFPTTAGSSGQVLKTDGAGVTSWRSISVPTLQKFLSGSGTYTTPANVLWIRLIMAGGGGGGGQANGVGGTAGGSSTFGLHTCNGGSGGGVGGGTAVAGGTASLGAGAVGIALSGGAGNGSSAALAGAGWSGGMGGSNALGGGGGGGGTNNTAAAGATNTGAGGGGGGANGNQPSGSGGGAGGYINAIIVSPAATYAYVVDPGGAGGGAGAGAGGSGVVIVEEYYQ